MSSNERESGLQLQPKQPTSVVKASNCCRPTGFGSGFGSGFGFGRDKDGV